jgi:hypothetical protein
VRAHAEVVVSIFHNPDRQLEHLSSQIDAVRVLWEKLPTIVEPYRSNALHRTPEGLRDRVRAAHRSGRGQWADALLDAARARPPKTEPKEMSWSELLDYVGRVDQVA